MTKLRILLATITLGLVAVVPCGQLTRGRANPGRCFL